MRTLAGLQPALAGQVYLSGEPAKDLAPREDARRLSIVPRLFFLRRTLAQ